jgi:dihydrolipoamide dehydrogenase
MKIMAKAMVKKLDRAKDKVTAHIEAAARSRRRSSTPSSPPWASWPIPRGSGWRSWASRSTAPFVVTDEYCRTGVEGLYVIGDATNGPWLAHKAATRASWWPR